MGKRGMSQSEHVGGFPQAGGFVGAWMDQDRGSRVGTWFCRAAHMWEAAQIRVNSRYPQSLESHRDPCQATLITSSSVAALPTPSDPGKKSRSCWFQEQISSLCCGKRLWGWFLSLMSWRESRIKM